MSVYLNSKKFCLDGSEIIVFFSDIKVLNFNFQNYLSHQEIIKAASIQNPVLRNKYIFCRYFIRLSVASVLGISLFFDEFLAGPFGKPLLPEPYSNISFNISHTNEKIIVAFCADGEVGVDIETRGRRVSKVLCDYVFRPEEICFVSRKDSRDRDNYFLRLWVLKEAVLKCEGSGLYKKPQDILIECSSIGIGLSAISVFMRNDCGSERFSACCIFDVKDVIGAIALRAINRNTF